MKLTAVSTTLLLFSIASASPTWMKFKVWQQSPNNGASAFATAIHVKDGSCDDYGSPVCCIEVKGDRGHACIYTSADKCDDAPEIPGWGKPTESACCRACTRSFPAECIGCTASGQDSKATEAERWLIL